MSHPVAPDLVVHADWGVQPHKRWAATAERSAQGWHLASLAPLTNAPTFTECLALPPTARALVGVDFPLGVPAAWAERAEVGSFPHLLRSLGTGRWRRFAEVATTAEEISLERPFYPYRTGPKGTVRRAHLVERLGLDWGDLHRRCDRATAQHRGACPLFWTLGANQVGKGALAGWTLLAAEDPDRTALWPFDGPLDALLAGPSPVVLAETYPADGYVTLGLGRIAGKRRNEVRRRAGGALLAAADRLGVQIDQPLHHEITSGLGHDAAGEDRFDALVGLLVMVAVLTGALASGEPGDDPAVPSVEGWILGRPAISPSGPP